MWCTILLLYYTSNVVWNTSYKTLNIIWQYLLITQVKCFQYFIFTMFLHPLDRMFWKCLFVNTLNTEYVHWKVKLYVLRPSRKNDLKFVTSCSHTNHSSHIYFYITSWLKCFEMFVNRIVKSNVSYHLSAVLVPFCGSTLPKRWLK